MTRFRAPEVEAERDWSDERPTVVTGALSYRV